MLVKLAVALLVLTVLEQVVGSDNIDLHDSLPEKPASQKGRLSLQNTGTRRVSAETGNGESLGWCDRSHVSARFARTRVSVAAKLSHAGDSSGGDWRDPAVFST